MKHFTLLFLLFSISFGSFSQSTKIDSLKELLTTQITTKHKVDILNEINKSEFYSYGKITTDYLQQAITLSNNIGYNKGLGEAYYYLAQQLFGQGAYDSAINIQLKSLAIHESLNNQVYIADNYSALGSIHAYQSNYATALDYFINALEIKEANGDSTGIANCFDEIAIIHKYQGNYEKAIEYFTQSLDIRKALKDEGLVANSLNNIGVIYRVMGDNQKARDYYQESLITKLKLDDKVGVSNAYNNIGITFFFEGKYEEALKFYLKSLEIREILQNKGTLSASYLNIGEVYAKLNNVEKAEEYLQMALELSTETGNKDDRMLTYEVMAQLDKKQGKYEEAFNNMIKYASLKDSIYSDVNNARINELQAKYEVDKTERELRLLQKENDIIRIKEENNSLIRNIFIIATLIISILVFAIMRSYWSELANSKLLKKQKEDIETRNEILKDLSHEKDQLMRIVAHDLRSPLNQVEGLVKLISFETERLSDQQKESISRINKAVNHSKELLSKILSTRSLDSAELKLNMEKIDMKSLISNVVKDYEIAASNKKIKVNIDVKEEDDFNTFADKNFAEQVIDNLLSNAIKFSPLEEKVDIALRKNNNKVLLEVKDNGPGITDEDKKLLFGKYQKLSAQPTGGETSTGLGLSIVKKYVDVMNGKVWYENDINQGGKFIVELNEA